MRGRSVESGLSALASAREGPALGWPGHFMWEHPRQTLQTATLPIHSTGHVSEGAECPGEMWRLFVRGESLEEKTQGFPLGQWPWLGPFLRLFWSSVHPGTHCGGREEATLNSSMVIGLDPQGLWTVFLVACTSTPCSKGLAPSTDPSTN